MMRIRQQKPDKGKRLGVSAAIEQEDWRKKNPAFSLQYTVSGFCVADCNQEEKAAFASTLLQLGKRTWLQILQSDKHGSGSEKILRKQMRVAIPQHVNEDQEFFTVVRFHDKSPMIGYVNQGIYYILWLDRNHDCY